MIFTYGKNTMTSGSFIGGDFWVNANPSANTSGYYRGIVGRAESVSGNSKNITGRLVGMEGGANHKGSGTVHEVYGVYGYSKNTSSGTVEELIGLKAYLDCASGTVEDFIGIQAYLNCGGGTVDYAYGIKIPAFVRTGTITNSWGIYQEGTVESNYFAGDVGVGTSSPSYPLEVNDDVDDVSIWTSKKVSATDFIYRTSVFDKSKNAWDYIKDASYYLTDGEIDYKKFYGYAGEFEIADYSRPVEETRVKEVWDETGCHEETIVTTTYPYKTTEEGVSICDEISVLRQAVFELKQENDMLKAQIAAINAKVGIE